MVGKIFLEKPPPMYIELASILPGFNSKMSKYETLRIISFPRRKCLRTTLITPQTVEDTFPEPRVRRDMNGFTKPEEFLSRNYVV
jgi:hypothetical protein